MTALQQDSRSHQLSVDSEWAFFRNGSVIRPPPQLSQVVPIGDKVDVSPGKRPRGHFLDSFDQRYQGHTLHSRSVLVNETLAYIRRDLYRE